MSTYRPQSSPLYGTRFHDDYRPTDHPEPVYYAKVVCDKCGILFTDTRTTFIEAGLICPVKPTAYPRGLAWFASEHARLNADHTTKVEVDEVEEEEDDDDLEDDPETEPPVRD